MKLTTEELRKRAEQHRKLAEVRPGYNLDTNKTLKDELFHETQVTLAEVYEELVEWRLRFGILGGAFEPTGSLK